MLDEFYEFLNSDAVHDFTTGDYEDIRNNFNYVSENLLTLVEQAKERKIERNELIEAMPKTKEAVDILTYLKEIRVDFSPFFCVLLKACHVVVKLQQLCFLQNCFFVCSFSERFCFSKRSPFWGKRKKK